MVTVRQSWLAQTVEEPIDPDLPICEAGLGFAVRLNKGDFIGRLALLRARVEGITRKLSCLVLDDPNKVVMGKEPVLDGDRCVGYVTSANYGYTVGNGIAYAYLPMDLAEEGRRLDVEYFGRRLGLKVVKEPLFDPAMTRLKS